MFEIDEKAFLCDMIDENLNIRAFNALLVDVPVLLDNLQQFEIGELLNGCKREIPQDLFSIARFMAWHSADIEQNLLDTFPYQEIVEIVLLSINCANWSKITIASLECLINVLRIHKSPPIDDIMASPLTDILVSGLTPDSEYFQFQCYLLQLIGNLMSLDVTVNDFFCAHGFLESVHASIGFPFATTALCASLNSVSGENLDAFVALLNCFLCQRDDEILINGFTQLLLRFDESLVDTSLVIERLPGWIEDESNNARVNAALALAAVMESPPENIFEHVEKQLKDVQDVDTHLRALDVLIAFHEQWKDLVSDELMMIMMDYANMLQYETAVACVHALVLYGSDSANLEFQVEIMRLCMNYISESEISSQCVATVRRMLEAAAEKGILDEFLPIVQPEIETIEADESEDARAIVALLLE